MVASWISAMLSDPARPADPIVRAPGDATFGGLPLRAGDVIADKYAIEGVLGAGGVGVVVAAHHRGLGERVAIKLLHADAAKSAENLARFAREARALARLRSEHVARVMDSGTLATGEPYLVLEHLEGRDLSDVLRDRGRLPLDVAVDHVIQACEGVAVAHAHGVIHRDLKPANLFLVRGPDGRPCVKVLDFGISKLQAAASEPNDPALTQAVSVVGSPLYMAPEQIESPSDVDERADVWSLATILYELVTGKAPFDAPTLPALCARICAGEPTPFDAHGVEVPMPVARAIERGLAKRRDERFPSVAALALALAPFGHGATAEVAARIARIARDRGLPLDPVEGLDPGTTAERSIAPVTSTRASGTKGGASARGDDPSPSSRGATSNRTIGAAAALALALGLVAFVARQDERVAVAPVAPAAPVVSSASAPSGPEGSSAKPAAAPVATEAAVISTAAPPLASSSTVASSSRAPIVRAPRSPSTRPARPKSKPSDVFSER